MFYVELHCHSNYSFKEGASHIDELLERARALEYPALALTDHDNLCGAMPFAQCAHRLHHNQARGLTPEEPQFIGPMGLTTFMRSGLGSPVTIMWTAWPFSVALISSWFTSR